MTLFKSMIEARERAAAKIMLQRHNHLLDTETRERLRAML